jgi:flagellar biosynthesis GTPase FlhF
MPLSIDGMNIGQYSYRPVGSTNNLQTNAIDRATPAAQRLSDAQEQLLERRRLDQERQDRLREAREERIAQQEQAEERALQVRQERQEAARALEEQQREQRLETLQEQRQEVLNPLSAESLARQRVQTEVTPPAANTAQVSPRLAAEAISTYRQTASPDFIGRSLVA